MTTLLNTSFFRTLIVLSISFSSFSQPLTVGLISTSDSVSGGYTLFSADNHGEVFLIDNCGKIVNNWVFDELPGLTSYLLENGNLLFAGKDSIHIRDWDNNPIWSYATTDNGIRQHHDIEPLPNGNVLCIASEFISEAELYASGRDSAFVSNNFKLDRIVEIQPFGSNGGSVVWEWRFWDHLVQEYDSTKANFGIVANHPELIDFNFEHINMDDWTHVNGIDYNADLDQIIISARAMSEVYIIDHSTTTAEAATHAGGNSGKGGDFLWRWGNQQVYQQGDSLDQKLFSQHDPKWVDNGYLYQGKISIFNNGGEEGNDTYSSVHLIEPTMSGTDYPLTNDLFGPASYFYTWNGHVLADTMLSRKKSSVQSLRDGGMLICETSKGRIIELHPDESPVWMYINPIAGAVFDQYDTPVLNAAFRATKYTNDFAGFVGKDMTPGGTIENTNPLTDSCVDYTELEEVVFEINIVNPVITGQIELKTTAESIELIDTHGRIVKFWNSTDLLNVQSVQSGMYILQLRSANQSSRTRVLIVN